MNICQPSINQIKAHISEAFMKTNYNEALNIYSQCLHSILEAILVYARGKTKWESLIASNIDNGSSVHFTIMQLLLYLKEKSLSSRDDDDAIGHYHHSIIRNNNFHGLNNVDDIYKLLITLDNGGGNNIEEIYVNDNFKHLLHKIVDVNLGSFDDDNNFDKWRQIYEHIVTYYPSNVMNLYSTANSLWYKQLKVLYKIYTKIVENKMIKGINSNAEETQGFSAFLNNLHEMKKNDIAQIKTTIQNLIDINTTQQRAVLDRGFSTLNKTIEESMNAKLGGLYRQQDETCAQNKLKEENKRLNRTNEDMRAANLEYRQQTEKYNEKLNSLVEELETKKKTISEYENNVRKLKEEMSDSETKNKEKAIQIEKEKSNLQETLNIQIEDLNQAIFSLQQKLTETEKKLQEKTVEIQREKSSLQNEKMDTDNKHEVEILSSQLQNMSDRVNFEIEQKIKFHNFFKELFEYISKIIQSQENFDTVDIIDKFVKEFEENEEMRDALNIFTTNIKNILEEKLKFKNAITGYQTSDYNLNEALRNSKEEIEEKAGEIERLNNNFIILRNENFEYKNERTTITDKLYKYVAATAEDKKANLNDLIDSLTNKLEHFYRVQENIEEKEKSLTNMMTTLKQPQKREKEISIMTNVKVKKEKDNL